MDDGGGRERGTVGVVNLVLGVNEKGRRCVCVEHRLEWQEMRAVG